MQESEHQNRRVAREELSPAAGAALPLPAGASENLLSPARGSGARAPYHQKAVLLEHSVLRGILRALIARVRYRDYGVGYLQDLGPESNKMADQGESSLLGNLKPVNKLI